MTNPSGNRRLFVAELSRGILQRESPDERAALAHAFPAEVETVATKGGQLGKRRVRIRHFREGRIVRFLVTANVIFFTKASRGDFHQSARLHRRASALGASADLGFDG